MADVIREFLVSLGYKVDPNSEKRFEASVRSATLQADLLGRAIAKSAEKVFEGVTQISKSFEQVYWQAQRTQATVQGIRAIGYAASQLGSSAENAGSAIESFGKQLKWNPGFEGFLKQIGVVTRENGNLRKSTDILLDFGKAIKNRPKAEQLGLAEVAGMPLDFLEAIQSGKLQKYLDEYDAKLKAHGLNSEEAAKKGAEFTQAMKSLGASLEIVGQKLMSEFAPPLQRFVDAFDKWTNDNGKSFVEVIEKIGETLGQLATAVDKVVAALKPLWEGFDSFSRQLTGQNGLTTAIEILIGLKLARWLLGVATAITAVGTAAAGALIGGSLMKFFGQLGVAGSVASGIETKKALESGNYQVDPNTGGLVRVPKGQGYKEPGTAAGGWGKLGQMWKNRPKWLGGTAGAGGSRSWRNNNPGNLEYGPFARKMGATGSDGRFAIFPDYDTGRKAQEELLFNSDGYRNLTLAQAIKRWAPASENNVAAYIAAVGGNDPDKLMSQYSAEERKKLLDAMQKHEGWRAGKPTAGPELLKSVTGAAKDAGLTVTSGYRSPYHPLSLANPSSAHSRGTAFDSRAKTPEEADAAMAKIRAMMAAKGLVEGRDYKILDEVRNPSSWATGPHIHTEFTASGAKMWGGDMPKGDMPAPKWPVMTPGQIEAINRVQANAAKVGGGTGAAPAAALTPSIASKGDTTVTINQSNKVEVIGSGDPSLTANQVGDAQKNLGQVLLRDVKGAVR